MVEENYARGKKNGRRRAGLDARSRLDTAHIA